MEKMETRERIIRNAINLFYKKGYSKASIRDLVKASNLTNAALYNHFKNKDDLLYVIINRMRSLYFNRMDNIITKYTLPLDKIKNFIKTHVSLVLKNKKAVKVFFEDTEQLSPKLRDNIINQQDKMFNLFKVLLDDLEKEGFLRPVNKTLATYCCFGMLNWTYRWFRRKKGGLSSEEVADGIVDIFLYGILIREQINDNVSAKTTLK
jgi:AcrR family transcriptional regulator